jgi:hypothetical protein
LALSRNLFYARRPSATRYIFLFPLYGPYESAGERQMAAAKEIERAQPLAAVPRQMLSSSSQALTSFHPMEPVVFAGQFLRRHVLITGRWVLPASLKRRLTADQMRYQRKGNSSVHLVRKLTSTPYPSWPMDFSPAWREREQAQDRHRCYSD